MPETLQQFIVLDDPTVILIDFLEFISKCPSVLLRDRVYSQVGFDHC